MGLTEMYLVGTLQLTFDAYFYTQDYFHPVEALTEIDGKINKLYMLHEHLYLSHTAIHSIHSS